MEKVTVIVVSFNTKSLLKSCIESLLDKSNGCRILIIDNNSKDGSVEYLKSVARRGKIEVFFNNTNLGFSGANNLGLKMAKSEYVLLLNSDTQLLANNTIEEISEWMSKNKEAGIVSCNLLNKDGSIQGTGGYFPSLFRVFSWMFFLDNVFFLDRVIKPFHPIHKNSFFYKGENFYKKERELDWVTGAFFMIRRKTFLDTGFFDEDYFMYTEEVDYCYRVKSKGWKVYFLPKWSIIHFGGASSAESFPIIKEIEGIKILYKKHMPFWQYPILRIFLKSGMFLRIFLYGLLKGGAYAKTYQHAFRQV
jgi:GT2 family glycosyltransferase